MMSVKENQSPKVMKKQCNIDKYEIFPGRKTLKKFSMDKNDSTAHILKQTNIFPFPISSNLSPLNENCAQNLSSQDSSFQPQAKRTRSKFSSRQLPNASGKLFSNGSEYLFPNKASDPNTLQRFQKEKQKHLISKQGQTDDNILCQKQSIKFCKNQILSRLHKRNRNDLHTFENNVQPANKLRMKDLDNLMKIDILPCKEMPTNLLHEAPKPAFSDNDQISAFKMSTFDDLSFSSHKNLSECNDLKIRDLAFDTSSMSSPEQNWQAIAASSCNLSDECDAVSFSPFLCELPAEKIGLDFAISDLKVVNKSSFPEFTSIVSRACQNYENSSEPVGNKAENEISVRELHDDTDEDATPIMGKEVLSLSDLESSPVPSIFTEDLVHVQNLHFCLPQTVDSTTKTMGSVSAMDPSLIPNMLQGQSHDVDFDSDDVLQSSLNRFSFNFSHMGSLGTSLRLMRLHRVLQGRKEKERENIMRLCRYL